MSWIDDLERHLTGERWSSRWASPGALAQHLDPETRQTPALRLIDDVLVDLLNTPDGRLIINMPPQEGKSQRASRWFPEWVLEQNPDTRIVLVSFEHHAARRFGRAVRDDVTAHGHDLGLAVRRDLSAQAEWQLAGHRGGMYSVGIGGALTGRPADLLIIDDPVKDRADADSETSRNAAWDWWTDVGSTRLSPGAPVVVIMTRWHDDDLGGRLIRAEDGGRWKVLRIPAEADHDPAQGETDPLGREPGEFLESAQGRTREQWEAIKIEKGYRTWQALYQGRPSSASGSYFKRDWWADGRARYGQPLWLEREDGTRVVTGMDELLTSWDLSFKDGDGTDLVAGGVWGRRGVDIYLLDLVWRRMDFPATCDAIREMARRWPQCGLHVVEDKANGPAVIAALRRMVPGLVPEEPQGSKQSRAAAASPLCEAGNVWLPTPEAATFDVGALLDELAGFPTATHDDAVDQLTQACNRLILQPLIAGEDLGDRGLVSAADLYPDVAMAGGYIPG